MDFKNITSEQQNAAKNKFLTQGVGVVMGTLMAFEDPNAVSAKWHDLINPQKYSEQAIISKMKSLAIRITQACPDPLLGKADVAYSLTTEKDEVIDFTYEDFYLFLRAAIEERRSTKEYKEKKAKIEALTKNINENKTIAEKRKAWQSELATLQKSL